MDDELKKKKPLHTAEHQFVLVCGEWNTWFSEDIFQTIVALALNECVSEEGHEKGRGFHRAIAGYLITRRKIYLVLHMAETGLAPFFSLLEEQLMQIISDKIKEVQDFFNTPGHAQKRVLLNVINEMALYEKHPMPNYWLAKLITGRTVEMVYYDPWLARIKDFIHHHPFCSVIDYAGGVGPVMITRRHYQA